MTGRRGFTLLEMMVATAVMAIAVVGLLSGIAGAARNASRMREYERVAQLARMQMDFLLSDLTLTGGRSGLFDPGQTGGMEAGWQAAITPTVLPPTPAPGQPVLERVELKVWWMQDDARRTFTLDAFRTRYLTGATAAAGAP